MNSVINSSLVRLDVDFGDSTTDVINNLATVIFDAGRASSADALAKDAQDREAKSPVRLLSPTAVPKPYLSLPWALLACARVWTSADLMAMPTWCSSLQHLLAAAKST